MTVILESKLDGSDAVRHYPVSLVRFHIERARAHALSAVALSRQEAVIEGSMLAVLFATLSLEALVNELSEDIVPAAEREDFYRARREYKAKGRPAAVAWKLKLLLKMGKAFEWSVKDALYVAVNELFGLRNALVHYRLSETAARSYLKTEPSKPNALGAQGFRVSLAQEPAQVEPPLLSRFTAHTAVGAANTAVRGLRLWANHDNAPEAVLSELDGLLLGAP